MEKARRSRINFDDLLRLAKRLRCVNNQAVSGEVRIGLAVGIGLDRLPENFASQKALVRLDRVSNREAGNLMRLAGDRRSGVDLIIRMLDELLVVITRNDLDMKQKLRRAR